jgi:CheY-like chemotaxis protein
MLVADYSLLWIALMATKGQSTSVRILIADDFAQWRAKVREMVHHSARVVGEASNGLEAVEKAAQLRPDIVLLDISMPHMNGLDAANLIRQTARSTGIVFLSAMRDAEIQQAALRVGHAFVWKRDALKKLLPAIEAAQAAAASAEASDSLSTRN